MTTTASTRRSFIQTAGAALSAPLAVAAASVPAAAAPVERDPNARLTYLEDLNAIRALNQQFARHMNAGAIEAVGALFADPRDAQLDAELRGIAPESFGADEVIDIAADRQTATAVLRCAVHLETEIGPSCPLVEMAKQQGGGVVRRTERGVFEQVYVRGDGLWKILRSSYRRA
jgi:hypothetical protein